MRKASGTFCIVLLLIISNVSGEACIRYDHSSTCTSYPITDFYFGLPVSQPDNIISREGDMTTNLGWMFVLNESYDLGPSLFFSAYKSSDGWHSQLGVRANLRYHLDNEFHLELSPGLILTDSPFPDGFAGYSAELSVSWKDWVGLATRLDFVDTFESGHDHVLHISLRFGSYAGMGLTSAGIIGGGLAYMESRR
ncbi:hypothetical protein DRQ25_08375 [Candidatus Fermentibacteria bacterium]|nr:MAG: hypothetical protein DRQ25_08375 [Candidatus Fermentibacteria bacterium]